MEITLSKDISVNINTETNTIDVIEHKNEKQEIIVQQVPIDGNQTGGYLYFKDGSCYIFGYLWWFLDDDKMDQLLSKLLPDSLACQLGYSIDIYYKDEFGDWVEKEDLGIFVECCEYYFNPYSDIFELIMEPLTGAMKIRELIQKELNGSEWFMTISI